jgi:putative sterol carrier protein
MKDAVRTAFEAIQQSGDAPQLRGVTAVYRFKIANAGSWTVTVDHGTIAVHEGGEAAADCIVHCDEDDFLRIRGGEHDLMTAAMQGRVEVEGSIPLLQKLLSQVRARRQRGSGREGGAQP